MFFCPRPHGGDAPLDADGSPMGRPQDDEQLTQGAAAEAVRLSAKALRMTLQKIGGDPVTPRFFSFKNKEDRSWKRCFETVFWGDQ